MITDSNPYQSPDDEISVAQFAGRFAGWTNLRLILLFFLPCALLLVSLAIGRLLDGSLHQIIFPVAFPITIVTSLCVSILSAHIHTVRQNANLGTLFLFSFVYLLAQAFALFLCLTAMQIIITRF